jgi:hypothetical protein
MSNTVIRVYGTFEDIEGNPANGQITFQPNVLRSLYDVVTHETLTSAARGARIDNATGAFEIFLLATDDPDRPLNTNWTYKVRLYIIGMGESTFDLAVPLAAVGTGIDLGTVIPVEFSEGTGGGGGGAYVTSVDGRTGTVTLSDLYQPLDADLTAIAVQGTQAFGRSLLNTVNSAAALTALGITQYPAPRVTTLASSATPTINTDSTDAVSITALATDITSMTTNLTGTPPNFGKLIFRILDTGVARNIAWGAKFIAGNVALPTTTIAGKQLMVGFIYNTTTAAWECVAQGSKP